MKGEPPPLSPLCRVTFDPSPGGRRQQQRAVSGGSCGAAAVAGVDGDGGSGGGPPGGARGEVGSLSLTTALTFWLKDWEEGRRETTETCQRLH